MRNTGPAAYTAVLVVVTTGCWSRPPECWSRCRNPCGHVRRNGGHHPGISGHVGPEYSPNWIVEQIALSSVDGTQVFNVMASPQFSSLSLPRHDEVTDFKGLNRVVESFEVETQTLSTAFNRLKVRYGFKRPFLKMDTQGYDVKILTHGGPAVKEFIGLQSELAVKKIYAESIDFRTAIT